MDIGSTKGGFTTETRSSTAPWTLTRTTHDGRLQLTQVFTFNAMSKSLKIDMTLTNLTGSTIDNVVLNRLVLSLVDGRGPIVLLPATTTGKAPQETRCSSGTTLASSAAYLDTGWCFDT